MTVADLIILMSYLFPILVVAAVFFAGLSLLILWKLGPSGRALLWANLRGRFLLMVLGRNNALRFQAIKPSSLPGTREDILPTRSGIFFPVNNSTYQIDGGRLCGIADSVHGILVNLKLAKLAEHAANGGIATAPSATGSQPTTQPQGEAQPPPTPTIEEVEDYEDPDSLIMMPFDTVEQGVDPQGKPRLWRVRKLLGFKKKPEFLGGKMKCDIFVPHPKDPTKMVRQTGLISSRLETIRIQDAKNLSDTNLNPTLLHSTVELEADRRARQYAGKINVNEMMKIILIGTVAVMLLAVVFGGAGGGGIQIPRLF